MACGLALAAGAAAQDTTDRPRPLDELDPTLVRRGDTPPGGSGADLRPERSLTEQLLQEDADLRAAMKEVLLARYRRETRILEERASVVAWTNGISRVIFVIVHAILAIALWAAIVEFRHSRRTRRSLGDAQQEIRVSLEGVALKTTLHGVLLLGIALVFYFLYLKFVYPVSVLGG